MPSVMSACAALTDRQRRVIATQTHVSTALVLAAGLLWHAGDQLDAHGRWDLQLVLLASATLALALSILPWLTHRLTPRTQRIGIWQALILALAPATVSVTTIGFEAVGASQLLLLAGVLAELAGRRRILLFFWSIAGTIFLFSLWHLRHPWL